MNSLIDIGVDDAKMVLDELIMLCLYARIMILE